MGSKGRIPAVHPRRPLPGRGLLHPEPYGPGMHALPPSAFHSFDMSPPPEVMEQKLATQHVEIDRLATENQRLAATHGTLRHELAAAQHELQMLQAQIGTVMSEKEQQMGGLMDKIAKMERELQASEPIKLQLQQAQADAKTLVSARQELIAKVQQLSQDLQRTHSDVQQVPALMSELENLRQEYQHCRATYEYEKKLYRDHLESLQVMEKNYINMRREVEKLQAELISSSNIERRSAFNETEAGHYNAAQNSYDDGYGVSQGRGPLPGGAGAPYAGAQPGSAPERPGYDAARGTGFEAQRGMYDLQRGPYDPYRGYYDTQPNTAAVQHGQVPHAATAPYGSATPPTHTGSGYDAPPRARNPAQR